MTADEIHVDQVLAGKGGDSDKARKVLDLDGRGNCTTEVYRHGELLPFAPQVLWVTTLARWADSDITATFVPVVKPAEEPKPIKGKAVAAGQLVMEGMTA